MLPTFLSSKWRNPGRENSKYRFEASRSKFPTGDKKEGNWKLFLSFFTQFLYPGDKYTHP